MPYLSWIAYGHDPMSLHGQLSQNLSSCSVETSLSYCIIRRKQVMKKLTGIMLLIALAAGMAFAGDSEKSNVKTQTINGYLVDVACARENSTHPEPGFAAKHSKNCLQM